MMALFTSELTKSRQQQLRMLDRRVRLTTEVLSTIRQIKLYAYEGFFGKRISAYREKELARLRKRKRSEASLAMLVVRSRRLSFHLMRTLLTTLVPMQTLIPILAAVLSFVTYSLSGHDLDVATIFASLQLFNIIKAPLTQLPTVITALSDAHVAIHRISQILTAEERAHELMINPAAFFAISAVGSFTYETVTPPDHRESGRFIKVVESKGDSTASEKEGRACSEGSNAERPFSLSDIDLHISKGALVCVIGRIGTGKTALLEAMLGEMRQTQGPPVTFSGSIGLVTQTPWIQSATIKDNILFGKDLDPDRLRQVIHACALTQDLEQLSDGMDTEIGGESGQRTAYMGADH